MSCKIHIPQNCDLHIFKKCVFGEDFSKPKILYQELTQGSAFCLDKEGAFFISNTGYLITGDDLEWLNIILNSKFIENCFRKFYSISLGETGLRWLSQYIINLPIIKPSSSTQIENLTEEDVNNYLFRIYGLSDNEINAIYL